VVLLLFFLALDSLLASGLFWSGAPPHRSCAHFAFLADLVGFEVPASQGQQSSHHDLPFETASICPSMTLSSEENIA
jgi:hypothetical protein